MKYLLIICVSAVAGMLLSNHIASVHAKEADAAKEIQFQQRVNELDKFYYGFCQEAKLDGYGKLKSYDNLCGDL